MDHFIEQSFKAIRYYLLNQPIDKDQLTVLKETDFVWGDFLVDAKILGESHMVTISNNHDFIQEICACTTLSTPSKGVVLEDELLAIGPTTFQTKNLSYAFNHKHIPFIGTGDCQKYLEGTDELSKDTSVTSLVHKFLPHPNNLENEPVTLLRIESSNKDLVVKSIHTYPDEHIFVYTESQITHLTDV